MPAPLQPGTLLIASLALEDPTFLRTVVVLLQYVPDELTLGVVVNRPLGDRARLYPSDELDSLTQGMAKSANLGGMFFQGGPVDPGSLIFLHRVDELGEDATRVHEGLYAGGDLDALRAHSGTAGAAAPRLRFFLGYASWAPGQLEDEINLGAWILAPADVDQVFSEESDLVWQQSLYALGGKYAPMSFIPEDPTLN